jgi:hypothetical protein
MPDIKGIMLGALRLATEKTTEEGIMFTGGTYVSAGPPVWAIIVAVPIVILMIGGFFATMGSGRKVRIYKIVSGRRVRDYDAERKLTRDTRP